MLSATITFLLKSALCSALFLGYYWLFLRNRKMNNYNRIFLLGTVAFSLVAPLLHLEWHQLQKTVAHPAIKLMEITNSGISEPEILAKGVAPIPVEDIMIGLYLLVCAVLLAELEMQVLRVYKIRKQGKIVKMDGFDLISTSEANAPFSFMSHLFWRNDIAIESKEGQQILQHELAHIRQMHSLDKIGMQLVTSIFWINPCFWIIQKELSQVHEFIADEAAIKDNDTEAFALMLLQTYYGDTFRDVVHPFFYSPIKRRLLMLNRSKKSKYHNLRKLIALPLLAGSLFLFSFRITDNVVRANKTITLVVDAAHGGHDNGAIGLHGYREKDMVLKIADKLEELSKDYNIRIVAVRKEDKYVTLQDRAVLTNGANADAMISLHMNSAPDGKPAGNEYEFILDERSPYFNKARLLSSAIGTKLGAMNIQSATHTRHLYVLANTKVPAITMECGYIANATNVDMIQNDATLEKLCRAILSSIVEYKSKS